MTQATSRLLKKSKNHLFNVMPVQTGIQIKLKNRQFLAVFWIPAFAGMTKLL